LAKLAGAGVGTASFVAEIDRRAEVEQASPDQDLEIWLWAA
jgi:hypothetical protein